MKKKNGFISTSVIYSFFLIFITLFLALILNYMHSRMLLNRINESAQNDINKIKNARIANLNVGDYVLFELDESKTQDILKPTVYILANKYDASSNKTFEFYSDTNTINPSYNNNSEFISINKFNNMKDTIKTYYKYYDTNNTLSISILSTDSLRNVKNNITDSNILNNIYNTDTNYIIFNNLSGTPYTENAYYNMRKYNISSDINPETINTLLASYCNVSYSNDILSYPSNNSFGYANLLNATITTPKYINYCYYANPENYTHEAKDGIVSEDETIESDLIPNNDTDSDTQDEVNQKNYFYRIMLRLDITDTTTNDLFIAGKGTKEDPYILRTGGKEL